MKNELSLSEKDLEILNLRKEGLTLKEVAALIFLSQIAIKKRLGKLRRRAGVKNDLELINYCWTNGIFNKAA